MQVGTESAWNQARVRSTVIALGLAVLPAVAGTGHAHAQPTPTDTLRQALERSRASGDSAAMALTNIGRTYRDLGLFERGRAALDEAVVLIALGRAYLAVGASGQALYGEDWVSPPPGTVPAPGGCRGGRRHAPGGR